MAGVFSASRFASTPVLEDEEGRRFFGLWKPPTVRLYGDESVFIVSEGLAGQLDLIAHRVYGNRALFWVIALANGIVDIAKEVVAGKKLYITKPERVAALVSDLNRQ